ncbi:hypothetical protein ACFPOI_43860 [Nonomuraea angiospora]|uniref:Uncharacterized protein n=1 Tax=Nonomuraea angiospora TaxID=46172 RepID=A0ABR9LNP5_9ACTN|nr:hypothetical protein [Nonomuraea angiospora]MBE1582271.1 hypothetical protein [Nonomuraea angiospora]
MTHADDEVTRAVAKLLRVPDRWRDFQINHHRVTKGYRIGPALLEKLLDLGLPHRSVAGERMFDSLDLQNVSLDLRLPSFVWMGMRSWARILEETDRHGRLVMSVRITARCSEPGHPGQCQFAFDKRKLADFAVGSLTKHNAQSYSVQASVSGTRLCLGSVFEPIVKAAGEMTYHILPEPLGSDLTFFTDSGLADCHLGSLHLATVARQQEIPLRSATGYYIARPYPVRHAWVELEVNGERHAADPFLLRTLSGWGMISPDQWPADRCLDGLLWKLDSADQLISHRGSPAETSIMISSAPVSVKP